MDEGATLNCILSKEEINALLRPETMEEGAAHPQPDIADLSQKLLPFFEKTLRSRNISLSISPIYREEEGRFLTLGKTNVLIFPMPFLYMCLERSLGGKIMDLDHAPKEASRIEMVFFQKLIFKTGDVLGIKGEMSQKEYISLKSDSFRVNVKMGEKSVFFYMVLPHKTGKEN